MSEVFFLCKWWEPILASVSEFERKTKMADSKMGKIQDGQIQDGYHHQVKWEWMSLSQIELVWVRVDWSENVFEWIWEKITRCLNPRWQCLNPTWEFKMAAIIKLSQNQWVKVFLCSGWIQDGRIQDGCHYEVESEWMNLSQIELVWVRVTVEWECFWVNLREDNKVSWIQDGSVWIQDGRIQDGCHHQVESESMSEGFLCRMAESKMAEFKMGAIIKLSQNEWIWVRLN